MTNESKVAPVTIKPVQFYRREWRDEKGVSLSGALYGGPRPIDVWDYGALVEHDIDRVVTLLSEVELVNYGHPSVGYLAQINCPIDDGFAPSPETFDWLVQLIKREVEDGRHVYVHCLAGCGRTGTICAAVLTELWSDGPEQWDSTNGKHGMNEALAVVRSMLGECCPETDTQLAALRLYDTRRMLRMSRGG